MFIWVVGNLAAKQVGDDGVEEVLEQSVIRDGSNSAEVMLEQSANRDEKYCKTVQRKCCFRKCLAKKSITKVSFHSFPKGAKTLQRYCHVMAYLSYVSYLSINNIESLSLRFCYSGV